ncbi:hypothetical protein GIB67_008796, partial [Kingdonia uniflora]
GQGLSVKTRALVAVVSALGNVGRTIEAETVFEEMKEGGLKPRTRAYNALLKGHVNMGSLRDAELIVTEMERARFCEMNRVIVLLLIWRIRMRGGGARRWVLAPKGSQSNSMEVTTVTQLTFGGVMFANHFLLKNRVNKVIKDQEELTYLARKALKAQKLIKEIDPEGSD